MKKMFYHAQFSTNKEWFFLGIKFNGSIALRKLQTLPAVIGFFHLPPDCSLSESPSRFSVLSLYSGYLTIRWVTSPLLIVLAYREGSYWVLDTLLFIRGLWTHSIQWELGNLGITYTLLGVWDIPIHPSSLMLDLSLPHFLYREDFT